MNSEDVVTELAQALKEKQAMLTIAESCTGGWIGQAITSVPGSSHWFERGFVVYTNIAKREMLGVSTNTLVRFGAVSEQTVVAMAEGALKNSNAKFSLAVTGIAGPGGDSEEKPVGLVWFAWTGKGKKTQGAKQQFSGDRHSIRRQAVATALEGMVVFVKES